MVISVAPLIIAHLDSKTVNAVIMQLEIEHPKGADAKETSVKEFLAFSSFAFSVPKPVLTFLTDGLNTEQDRHLQAFYPSVPTPPPNCFKI